MYIKDYFAMALLLIVALIACFDVILSRKKMLCEKNIENIHCTKERGEILVNLLSVTYVPMVFELIDTEKLYAYIIICAVTILMAALYIRIFRYNKHIRALERQQAK